MFDEKSWVIKSCETIPLSMQLIWFYKFLFYIKNLVLSNRRLELSAAHRALCRRPRRRSWQGRGCRPPDSGWPAPWRVDCCRITEGRLTKKTIRSSTAAKNSGELPEQQRVTCPGTMIIWVARQLPVTILWDRTGRTCTTSAQAVHTGVLRQYADYGGGAVWS
jgi:hypothetical protein